MGLFKKKKKNKVLDAYLYPQKQKRQKTKNYIAFLVLFVIVIFAVDFYVNPSSQYNLEKNNAVTITSINEDDLILKYPTKNVNFETLKSKLNNCGLNNVANNINIITISSQSNAPTSNISLSFDELSYLANCVLSYNNNFVLLDTYWEIDSNDNNCLKMFLTYKYFSSYRNTPYNIVYFQHSMNYSIANNTYSNVELNALNVQGNTTKLNEIKNSLSNTFSQFLLTTNAIELENDKEYKSLCKRLGFSSVSITENEITYNI